MGEDPKATAKLQPRSAQGVWRGPLPWISEASLCSTIPLLWASIHGRLRCEGLPELPARLRSDVVAERTARYWKAACAVGKPSLFRVLVRVCAWDLALGTFCSCAQGFLASFVRPLILKQLVESLTKDDAGSPELWTMLLGVALLVEGVCAADRVYFGADMVSMTAVSAISTLTQEHSAELPSCLQDTGPSVVNIVGTDAVRLVENQKGLILLPLGVCSILSGVAALLAMLGPMGLVGLVPMFMMLGVNAVLARLAEDAEHANLELVDARMHIMGQVVHGVKAVKLTAWEEKYMKLIAEARVRECVPLKKWRIYLQYTRQCGRANPIIASCVLFTVQALVLPKAMARPADVFAAANIFLSLRLPFIALPESMTYWATLHVTLARVEAFLALPRAERRPEPAPLLATEAPLGPIAGHTVKVEGASFSWPDGDCARIPALEGLHFTARQGEMVAIVGDVGSGKTTLLAGLLGDLRLSAGCCEVQQPIGFVPQRPFVLSGTLQRNVAMGRPGDVPAAVRAAALEPDVERLGGLLAEVGERGVTLSGGQAQRLALARALLAKPQVLMADDPLSAVDARSSVAIFTALEAYARDGGCIVMAVNQLHLLRRFSRIVVLVPPSTPVVIEVTRGCADAGVLASLKGELGDAIRQTFATSPHSAGKSTEAFGDAGDEGDADASKVVGKRCSSQALTSKDTQSTGAVKWAVIRHYLRGMGLGYAGLCLVLCVATYAAMGFVDRWLAIWVNDAEDAMAAGEELNHTWHVCIFIAGCVVFAALLLWTSYAFAEGGVRSSRNLHQLCLERLLHAPLSWFESMPSGRILSRFSSDVALVDQAVAQWADNLAQVTCTVLLLIIQTVFVVPFCIVPFLAAGLLFGMLQRPAQRMAQEVKRWAIDSMSPLLTTISETHSGRQSLRAMGLTPLMAGFLNESLDIYTRFHRSAQLPVDFGILASALISILVGCSTSVFCLLSREFLSGSLMALALTYSFLVPYFMTFYGDILNRLLVSLTGLERLLHYVDLEQEPAWHLPGEEALAGPAWPSAGKLVFEDVSLVYRAGLAPALSGVSFAVPGGSSVGVVGRSGAGKSSLLGLLFRLREPTSGRVLVDGVDIARLGLQVLRRRLAILPQEPLLFPGTCRENLDPFGEHADERLRQTLAEVGLPDLLEDIGRTGVSSGGLAALSVGERQLLALARLMLRPEADSRVVLFDEPTSSVDAATDRRVQQALQGRFGKSTVLTVAHRLQTVLSADCILVLDAGRVAELGPPAKLLADAKSQFGLMAREAGLRMTGSRGQVGHECLLQLLRHFTAVAQS